MKCPHCGAWSEVLETRNARRRRQCANGHKFATVEICESDSRAYSYRNKQIIEAVQAGKTMTEVAQSFGLRDHSQVSRIVKRADPSFNARRAGQLAMWARRKSNDK